MSAVKGTISGWRGGGGDGDRNPATNQYKGLVSFIADIRSARARELEEKRVNKELANIRQKFKEGKMTSYDKKKYVCKLLYIYILGWDLDFGHLEAVNLISATKFSEKQIGYLAVTLFFHESHELLHLVVNSIRKDLLDHNELYNCLALHAIANVGGRSLGESLAPDVHRLLISAMSNSFVKKKAALTLLRLYRKHPPIIQAEWADRMIALMDDRDMGVALSVTSLIMVLAHDNPEPYKASYNKAASRLKKIVIDKECAEDYLYYNVPCPWIQVKLLRLLQYYPPSEDTYIRELIRNSISATLECAMDASKNVQQNNAQNAILFEAIKLVIHLDTEEDLMVQISSRLGKFIVARETNVRYLGLEAMTHLASRGETETLEPIKEQQKPIIASLRDRDITVRRQGLDLLYSMCDHSNAQSIVTELLKHLQNADYAIREEMVLKIAILAEKYATDAQWYVDISLRLLSMAGDHVSDEVWQRVVQIVTNNEELQVYAVQHILKYIKSDQCHESLAKIGAYLLGEFGHLIADDEGCSPIEQFLALSNKLSGCSLETRGIILSAFIKFVNLFPEIKPQLIEIFRVYGDDLDAELQQRACEFMVLATLPTDDLLRTVFDEMPPFPERASALLSRVRVKHTKGKRPDSRQMSGLTINTNETSVENSVTSNGAGTSRSAGGLNDLEGLDMTSPNGTPSSAIAPNLSAGWRDGYERLLIRSEGVLYEDSQLQIGLRSEYRAQVGCLIIYFQNKNPFMIESFTSSVDTARCPSSALKPDTKSLPDTTIHAGTQSQQTVMLEAKTVFEEAPILRVSYLAGSLQTVNLQLPVVLHKYMEPAALNAEDFFKRWKQIGGAPREAQKVFGLAGKGQSFTQDSTRKVVEGFRWGVLEGVDPNPKNFVGATILNTSEGGKFGCLMRLEPNYDTLMYRLTIRATNEAVPPILLKHMQERLAQGDKIVR